MVGDFLKILILEDGDIMNKFSSSRNKFNKLNNEQQSNANLLDKLTRLTVKIDSNSLSKKIITIDILKNYPIIFTTEGVEG